MGLGWFGVSVGCVGIFVIHFGLFWIASGCFGMGFGWIELFFRLGLFGALCGLLSTFQYALCLHGSIACHANIISKIAC